MIEPYDMHMKLNKTKCNVIMKGSKNVAEYLLKLQGTSLPS